MAATRRISSHILVSDPGVAYLGYFTLDFFGDRLHFVDTINRKYVESLVRSYKRDVINGYITAEDAKKEIKKTIENYLYFVDDVVFQRKAVTKNYDHSRPINLKKEPTNAEEFFNQNKRTYNNNPWLQKDLFR